MPSTKYNHYILVRLFDNYKIIIKEDFKDYKKCEEENPCKNDDPCEYKELCENDEDSERVQSCEHYIKEYVKNFNFDLSSTCRTVTHYLQNQKSTNEINTYVGCMYLYYWLYNDLLHKNKNSVYIKNLYDAFINAFNRNTVTPICSDFNMHLTQEVLENLKDIYEINTKLYNFINGRGECSGDRKCKCGEECANTYMRHQKNCQSNQYPDFCNALKNIRQQYNEEMEKEKCNNIEYQILPIFQAKNIRVSPLIPIVIILVISIFLFNIYKFTTFGSYFRRIIKRKRNKWNNIVEEYNMFQNYETMNSIPKNSIYNIKYSSV
ncbi:variable surface protein [Plasmodium gonderi]|uniref:Variable surface protein n=1 Tax=Plasmodium gonderi TaxID=77519 RepID=A0A1Y1JJV6_PLAGO|nr:variable surface protein [Plasmodium gonderi]GAW82731.1 variable surface protein [Plasmodium gonderi]